jgi:hypothetical protein
VVGDTIVLDDNEALSLLNEESFDPRTVAVLSPGNQASALTPGGGSNNPNESALHSPATVLEASPGRLILRIAPQAPGLLVVSQPFYPGWRARVDGRPVPIIRVDFLLQGIPVGAGEQRVEVTYHLSPLPGLLGLLTLVGCVIGLLRWGRGAQR